MVPLTQRDSFMIDVQKDAELRPLRAFLFGERVTEGIPGPTTRAKLFDSLRRADAKIFQEQLEDLGRRKISPNSEWIGDDCVIFLLLLGARKFESGEAIIDKILNCRGATTNAQAQHVNQAFSAIRRREFAVEGEYAFIKCAFRVLAEDWTPSEIECIKLYKQISSPGFTEQLDPFLRLVALRAFDLVIEHRAPIDGAATWNQVLSRIQEEGGKLSLGQFWTLLKHIRLSVIGTILSFLVAVFGGGLAWRWLSPSSVQQPRIQTSTPAGVVAVENRDDTVHAFPPTGFFTNASQEVAVSGISCLRLFDQQIDVLTNVLSAGKKLHVLIMHPSSVAVDALSKAEKKDVLGDIRQTLAIIRREGLSRRPGFELRFFTNLPPFTAIMSDGDVAPFGAKPNDANGQIRVQPRTEFGTQHRGVIIQFKKQLGPPNGVFDFFAEDLRMQWSEAKPDPALLQ